jgi:hypothetical protein
MLASGHAEAAVGVRNLAGLRVDIRADVRAKSAMLR